MIRIVISLSFSLPRVPGSPIASATSFAKGERALPITYSNAIPKPMHASLSMFLRSTLTTRPFLIRANCPFSSAKSAVRGKFNSTTLPAWTGVVIGTVMKTPTLLMLELRPLKNLFASGTQTLTGQHRLARIHFRCSVKTSIA